MTIEIVTFPINSMVDLSISFLYVYQRYQRVNGGFGILTLTSPIFWPCMGVIYLPQTHTHIKTYIDIDSAHTHILKQHDSMYRDFLESYAQPWW